MIIFACSLFGVVVYFAVSFLVPEEGPDRIEAEFVDNDDKSDS